MKKSELTLLIRKIVREEIELKMDSLKDVIKKSIPKTKVVENTKPSSLIESLGIEELDNETSETPKQKPVSVDQAGGMLNWIKQTTPSFSQEERDQMNKSGVDLSMLMKEEASSIEGGVELKTQSVPPLNESAVPNMNSILGRANKILKKSLENRK